MLIRQVVKGRKADYEGSYLKEIIGEGFRQDIWYEIKLGIDPEFVKKDIVKEKCFIVVEDFCRDGSYIDT